MPVVLFPNSSGMGGVEAHVIQLAASLRHRGFPVAAICSPRNDLRALREGLIHTGVTVHEISDRDGSHGGIVRRTQRLIATLRQYPGCVLHMHYGGYGGGELVQLAAGLAGVRAIVRTEHVPPVPPVTRKGRMLVHLRDRFLSKVICVSDQNRQEHVGVLGRDERLCVVVHNGVDLTRFTPTISGAGVAAEFGFADDAPIVGTVARLDEERKGIGYFLEMSVRVRDVHPSVRFLVVGDGRLRSRLEAGAKRLGLSEVLGFAGTRDDVPRLLAAMTVFVMPSLYEGGPYSLLEAMAMARPVVSTPAGVAPFVVRDHATGLVVPVEDAGALARGVMELLADRDLGERLGRAGRDLIAAGFSVDAMVDSVIDVYREALAPVPAGQPILDL
jgi:glycosyltransferase involved in cell wall biosynthesis